jgi:hypothetical protein
LRLISTAPSLRFVNVASNESISTSENEPWLSALPDVVLSKIVFLEEWDWKCREWAVDRNPDFVACVDRTHSSYYLWKSSRAKSSDE